MYRARFSGSPPFARDFFSGANSGGAEKGGGGKGGVKTEGGGFFDQKNGPQSDPFFWFIANCIKIAKTQKIDFFDFFDKSGGGGKGG